MSNVKQKLLEALDCSVEDLSEEVLLHALLDANKNLKQQIMHLHGELSHLKENLFDEQERFKKEVHEMRSNPAYGAEGTFVFESTTIGIRIICKSGQIVSVLQYSRSNNHTQCVMQPVSSA